MGGRYGASSDGSSAYQDRRPAQSEREPEQQTVAEAVRSVTQQQQQAAQSPTETQDQDRSTHTSTQSSTPTAGSHSGTGGRNRSPLDLGDSVTSLVSTVTDADDAVADVIASNLIELIRQANDESFPDDESSK